MPVPPPPPFWPEKATEWVALIGGTLGGVLGTFGFILSILNYRRDRAKIRLHLRPHMRVNAPGYDPNANHLILRVINEGRRSVQIAHGAARYYHGDHFTFAHTLVRGSPVLSEESPETTLIAKEDFVLDDIWYFYVAAPLREYRIYVHPIPKRWWRAIRTWPQRIRHDRQVRERRNNRESYEVIEAKADEVSDQKSVITVQDTKAQRMQRLGPLLTAVTDVLDHVHHFRQRFTNTFDHHNVLLRVPDPPLHAPLEAVAPIASTVSVKVHKNVGVAVERLRILDRLHQEVGASLRNSVGRGLTGSAAEAVKKQADEECKHLEFYLRPVREEVERMIEEAPD